MSIIITIIEAMTSLFPIAYVIFFIITLDFYLTEYRQLGKILDAYARGGHYILGYGDASLGWVGAKKRRILIWVAVRGPPDNYCLPDSIAKIVISSSKRWMLIGYSILAFIPLYILTAILASDHTGFAPVLIIYFASIALYTFTWFASRSPYETSKQQR